MLKGGSYAYFSLSLLDLSSCLTEISLFLPYKVLEGTAYVLDEDSARKTLRAQVVLSLSLWRCYVFPIW